MRDSRSLRALSERLSAVRRIGVSAALLAFLGLLTVAAVASASPAAPITFQLTQPDGTVFLARQYGDEDANGTETADGYTILQDGSGVWRYAQLTDLGGISAGQTPADHAAPIGDGLHLRGLVRSVGANGASSVSSAASVSGAAAASASINLGREPELVLLVRFSNQAPSAKSTAAAWHQKYFGTSSSVADFYSDNSYGAFSLTPATETQGKANDGVVGWLSLAMKHPNTKGDVGAAGNLAVFVAAVKAASPYVNFASYDENGDGFIESNELHVSVILAGYEAAYSTTCGNSVWSHESSIGSVAQSASADGVILGYAGAGGSYTESGEQHCTLVDGKKQAHLATIGLLAHEIGHTLGLPDLYDTDYSSYGIGAWSVMSLGAWNSAGNGQLGSSPAMLDPWSKSVEGWVAPVQRSGTVSLGNAETSSQVIELLPNAGGVDWSMGTPGTGQYFLVENRQKIGYDAGLPGCGILIWHIDESMADNSNDHERLVDLVQGDGHDDLNKKYGSAGNAGDAGDVFSGSGQAKAFTNRTSPSSKLYDGVASGVSATGISAPCGTSAATLTVSVAGVIASN